MTQLAYKLLSGLVFTVVIFIAGWQVKGAFVAKEELGIEKAKKEFAASYRAAEAVQSTILENKLSEFKQNDKVIERERTKIVDRPIYHMDCLDADGLRLIESARTGKADTIKPADGVPATN